MATIEIEFSDDAEDPETQAARLAAAHGVYHEAAWEDGVHGEYFVTYEFKGTRAQLVELVKDHTGTDAESFADLLSEIQEHGGNDDDGKNA